MLSRRAVRPPPDVVVVLLMLDGIRWQELFRGVDPDLARHFGLRSSELQSAAELMPNTQRLRERRGTALGGAIQPMWASGPNFVSLPGYTEVFSGRPASCAYNDCPAPGRFTLADAFAEAPDSERGDVAVIASWPGIRKAAARHPERIVLSAGRSQAHNEELLRFDAEASRLLDAGRSGSGFPGHGDYRPDQATAEIALHYLTTRRPRFLFIGLGDGDEYGHRRDYRAYLRSLGEADRVVGRTLRALDELSLHHGTETALFISTDHGRSSAFESHGGHAPESGRVWLIAAGTRIAPRGEVALGRTPRLADIAPTVRALTGLPSEQALLGSGQPLSELMAPAPTDDVALAEWQ